VTVLEQRIDADAAAERAAALARRAREMIIAAALVGIVGIAAAVLGRGQVSASLLLGAAVGIAIAALARGDRQKLLTRIVAQGDGERCADAMRLAADLVRGPRRRRLAAGLERAASVARPGVHDYTHVRPDRAFAARAELLALAAAFRDDDATIAPASAALCRRMLCEAASSPLYNPRIPEDELARLLRTIASGIRTRRDPRSSA
jgi:hypothetical protein